MCDVLLVGLLKQCFQSFRRQLVFPLHFAFDEKCLVLVAG